MLKLDFVTVLQKRFAEKESLLQVILGPRQVGKTTGIKQLIQNHQFRHVYFSADDLLAPGRANILEPWQAAVLSGPHTLLVLDEIQKVSNWPEIIKSLWDDLSPGKRFKCVLLGSGSLSLQTGLSESLTGRFEELHVPHWNFHDSQRAFGLTLDQFLVYGGYPGSYAYIGDFDRWQSYVRNSVVETVIGKDILFQRTVTKPALFRQAFSILSHYPAQEISYSKLLGQLQDRGNTDLVKHYIELYEGAFLFKALHKYSAKPVLRKSSSPKILPMCPALHTIVAGPLGIKSPETKGRLFELAVGMELCRLPGELYYWREGEHEIDYVHVHAGRVTALEVKSGRRHTANGIDAFSAKFPGAKTVIVTPDNFALLSRHAGEFLEQLWGVRVEPGEITGT